MQLETLPLQSFLSPSPERFCIHIPVRRAGAIKEAGKPQAEGRLSPGSPASDQPRIPKQKLSCLHKGKAWLGQHGEMGMICALTSY